MTDFNWTCPHCNRDVTIGVSRSSFSAHYLKIDNASGQVVFTSRFFVCPNPDCQKFTLSASLHDFDYEMGNPRVRAVLETWQLMPEGEAKVFPDYIPEVIRNDYVEACLIVGKSPKASATLSRRCLQGILRDFWHVTPGRLVDEIRQIKDKTDGATWGAIDAVRKIGNIGAHMENDINVIVDVDPGEAGLLIELVETLLTEWYVGRHDREQRMAAIVAVAQSKAEAKNPDAAQ